jgi:hypothetical protein
VDHSYKEEQITQLCIQICPVAIKKSEARNYFTSKTRMLDQTIYRGRCFYFINLNFVDLINLNSLSVKYWFTVFHPESEGVIQAGGSVN